MDGSTVRLWLRVALLSLLGMWGGGASSSHAQSQVEPQSQAHARVQQGELAGEVLDGNGVIVRVFRGIPYAAVPVGDLRWRAPQEAKPWAGVRDATQFGKACMQTGKVWDFIPASAQSEDCLTLNVWTPVRDSVGTLGKSPVASQLLPVMFYIHGGSFVGGWSGQEEHEGAELARYGVVVVNINYRLGVFGFLAHPDLSAESPQHASGNYGLLDQIAALKWVQQNAAAFGGDPAQVTIFGESAGAGSVAYLLASPLAKGLFARAIAESPSIFAGEKFLRADQNAAGQTPMEEIGSAVSPRIADLRAMTTEQVMEAAEKTSESLFGQNGTGKIAIWPASKLHTGEAHDGPWRVVVDGWVVPGTLDQAFANGCGSSVPLIAGTNQDEGLLFTNHLPIKTEADYRHYLDNFPPRVGQMRAVYGGETTQGYHDAVTQIITDGLFAYGTHRLVVAMNQRQPNGVYLYRFYGTHSTAPHAAEVPLVFGHVSSEANVALSKTMMGYWTQFAKTGDPNGEGLPRWPRYQELLPQRIDLAPETQAEDDLDVGEYPIYRAVYAKYQEMKNPAQCTQ